MNECGECGLDFGSVSAFDRHRVGVHEYTLAEGMALDPSRFDGRRCLHEHEITDLVDTQDRPVFARNEFGRWSLAAALEQARSLRTV